MRFNKGDKVVIEINGVLPDDDGNPVYSTGNGYFGEVIPLEESAEPLLAYTEPLNDKIKRQEEEIIRLLKENAELKRDLEYYHTGTDTCDIESARAAGQQEAWKLALKLRYMDYEDKVECFGLGYDGKEKWIEIMEKYTYAEAAAKVAEWKKAKEEICVGDVVECEGSYGVVVGVGECYIKGFTSDWTPFQWMKQSCTKTGRHIDVDAWLAQIGGDCNE